MPGRVNWIEADAYLFDIDGTLLNASGGAHYNAFHSALRTTFHLDCKIDGVPLHGSTDISILRAVLTREGLVNGEFERGLEAALRHMGDEVERNRDQLRAEVCPSVPALLELLASQGKLLGVATGNLERIGWLKIEAGGLRERFAFGAFSDRHEKREDILRQAMEEVRRRLGRGARVCYIGDTPQDISAAKAAALPVIAVATGIYSVEDLAGHGPDLCVTCCSDLLEVARGKTV